MAIVLLLIFFILTALALSVWRLRDHSADRKAMHQLARHQPVQCSTFSAEMVASLPEPVRRYFLYAISPGTPLTDVAKITMTGRFGMGTKDEPNYLHFAATQVLAMPTGFVWKMQARRGLMRLSGSDSQRWTRFWLLGLLPIARMGGDPNHTRSAFGRYVAEALFWTPVAVLPGPDVCWQSLGADSARVTVTHKGLSQSVDLTVAANGQPTEVQFERWSNANPAKQYQLQPFGGYLSEFRSFGGFRLPAHVEAGNHFGTDRYFPFFIANVSAVEFPRE